MLCAPRSSLAVRVVRVVVSVLFCLVVAAPAKALTIQAPLGGAAITLPADRLLCGLVPEGWSADVTRKHLKPPAAGRIGQTAEVTLASSLAGCTNGNGEKATLIVTGNLPAFDAASVTLSVDAGRLEIRGDGLE